MLVIFLFPEKWLLKLPLRISRKKAEKISKLLENKKVVIKREVGEEGKLFGSVTSQDVGAAIKEKFGVEIDHRKIQLEEPIKVIGTREISIRLWPELEVKLKVEVKKG